MLNGGRVAAVLPVFALLAGCAASGPNDGFQQDLRVVSAPAGAACEVRRGEALLTSIAATPATVRVAKSGDPLHLICEAPGFLPTRLNVASSRDGRMMAAYALAGGLLGVMAASASGDAFRYPDEVAVSLWPTSFPDAAARDAFFDARTGEVEALHQAVSAGRPTCAADDSGCHARAARYDAARQAEIEAVRAARAAARIGT